MTDEVKQRIQADLYSRSIKQQLHDLPKMGDAEVEYGYGFYTSDLPGNKDIIFVVGNNLLYHNQSLRDTKHSVYPYSLEGKFLPRYDVKRNCSGTFFKSLKKIA